MRHASQCLGRVLRGKDDYGIMVLADKRFKTKKEQLPSWIAGQLLLTDEDHSVDSAVSTAKRFLRSIAQPFNTKDQEGISTWSARDLAKHQEEESERKIRELRDGVALEEAQAREMAERGERRVVDEFDEDEIDEEDLAEMMALDAATA
jgi:DNA excision repair protein ERCC-2